MDSRTLFDRAGLVIPGGVNSPVRAFGSVGGEPLYVQAGSGSRLRTVEGYTLVDFCCSWGPLILGHAHPEVVAAVAAAGPPPRAPARTGRRTTTDDDVRTGSRRTLRGDGASRSRRVRRSRTEGSRP